MDPYMGGGQMIKKVTMEKSTWNDIPWKFEAGTPPIAQVIGLAASIDFINEVGIKNIFEHENKLTNYTYAHM